MCLLARRKGRPNQLIASRMQACVILAIMTVAVVLGCADRTGRTMLTFDGLDTPTKRFKGVLRLPDERPSPVPVVVLVHGSAGVDDRYAFHRSALLDAGIGTFEVDFKTGVFTSPGDRPPMATFHPWAFGALTALRSHPQVDSENIAIMGFSLGGHLSVSVASQKVKERWLPPSTPGFVAHVGFYPACKWLKKNFDARGPTGAPILILCGEKDTWGDGENCRDFSKWLNHTRKETVFLKIYPKVHHGFDRKGSWEGHAPYAINQTAVLKWDAGAAQDSRKRAVSFLRKAFGI